MNTPNVFSEGMYPSPAKNAGFGISEKSRTERKVRISEKAAADIILRGGRNVKIAPAVPDSYIHWPYRYGGRRLQQIPEVHTTSAERYTGHTGSATGVWHCARSWA